MTRLPRPLGSSARMVLAASAALLMCIALSCSKKDSTDSGGNPVGSTGSGGSASVAGTVTDVTSNAPIASATIAVQGKTTTTGSDGKYSITGLSATSDTITAKHNGHRNFSQAVTLSASQTVNIQMTAAPEADANGNWGGGWNNSTFGTSGGASMTATVDTVAQTFQSTLTFTGNVFGQSAPGAQTVSTSYTTTGATFNGTSSFFGTVTGSLTPGAALIVPTRLGPFATPTANLTGAMTNVPVGNILRVDITGTATSAAINAGYTVTFVAGNKAQGTVTLTKSGTTGPTTPSTTDRYVCNKTGEDVSKLTDFNVQSYNGTTITQVDLTFTSKDAVGPYGAKLTITPAGKSAQSASATAPVARLSDSNIVSFLFTPAISVTKGTAVLFHPEQTSGTPSDGLHFDGASPGCPVSFGTGAPPVHIYGAP